MTFDQLKKRVGKNIKYYDDTNGWLGSRDVTETDIGDYVNEVYCEEMFPLFASRWPHLFRQTGTMDSWIMSAVVNATSTGSTLVIDTDSDSEFANSMIGLTVYNLTDDETRVITNYTSTSTVTVDEDIDNDWDGDTIYVLGQEFAFGGDAVDLFSVERVRVKYSSVSTATYKIAEMRERQDLFITGNEVGSKATPYVYLTTITDSGNLYNAIGIFPGFDEKVSKGLEIDYISKPIPITGSGVTPVIPIQESIICGATMKAYEKKQDIKMANYWAGKFEMAKKRDISRYKPNTTNVPTTIKISRTAAYIHRRII